MDKIKNHGIDGNKINKKQNGDCRSGDENAVVSGSRDVMFFENRIAREWLSTEVAAYFLSVSPNALRIMVHRGQVHAYKFGRRLRFSLQDCKLLFSRKEV